MSRLGYLYVYPSGGSAGGSAVKALPSTGAGQQRSGAAVTMLIGAMALIGLITTMAMVRARERR